MIRRILWSLAGLLALLMGTVLWLNLRGEEDIDDLPPITPPTAERIARGAYLARAGNCAGCHTAQGGKSYAGGRAIETPFGNVYAGNLTPDKETGLGDWTADHFWRALHNGRSRNGRLLLPVFPYTSYTRVTREDADLLFDFLRSLKPEKRLNTPHQLRWPYSSQVALAVWRALYFSPLPAPADAPNTAQWHRGAYLVRGLGHCSACHTARNALGASRDALDLGGALIPMQNWYAPSLTSPTEASVASWPVSDVVSLLGHGVSPRGSVLGPMAQVVRDSTQHLTQPDLEAISAYLHDLPGARRETSPAAVAPTTSPAAMLQRGARIYEQRCADCHGARGEGIAGAYPPLAGNRAVTMETTTNLVQIVLNGGFPPATQGNPRPYGMPPFVLALTDADIAAVLTYLRSSWGNQAAPVTEWAVSQQRELARN